MNISTLLEYCEDQAITGAVASTDVIDHLAGGHTLDHELKLHVRVTETFNNLDNLLVRFQSDDADSFDTGAGSTPQENEILATIPLADLALPAGKTGILVATVRTPRLVRRFSRVFWDIDGTDPAAGQASAFLSFSDAENDFTVAL